MATKEGVTCTCKYDDFHEVRLPFIARTFFHHMLVREEEDHLLVLYAQFVVQYLEVFTKVALTVASTECDLKHFTVCCESSQSGDTLFATPTNAHQKSVPLRHTDDAVYPRKMVQGIIEQYQIHGLVSLIVFFKDL